MATTGSGRDLRAAIWVVEDSVVYRETIADVLNATDRYRCAAQFGDVESMRVALTDRHAPPKLVLMDLSLPGQNGIDGVKAIRATHPLLPVVMLTVHQSNDRIFEAICAGASGYLLKSASQDDLVRAIDSVMDGGAAMDGQIARRVLQMFAGLATPRADYRLTEREQEILQHLVDGATKVMIAERLGLSPHTIDGRIRTIYSKLHVHNRSGAVSKAVRERLV